MWLRIRSISTSMLLLPGIVARERRDSDFVGEVMHARHELEVRVVPKLVEVAFVRNQLPQLPLHAQCPAQPREGLRFFTRQGEIACEVEKDNRLLRLGPVRLL